jgi:hypothetical protein
MSLAKLTQQQLLEAQKALERQIEILRCPAGGPDWRNMPPDNRQLITELEAKLAEVNSRLVVGGAPHA